MQKQCNTRLNSYIFYIVLLVVVLWFVSTSGQLLYLDGSRLVYSITQDFKFHNDFPHLRYASFIYQAPLIGIIKYIDKASTVGNIIYITSFIISFYVALSFTTSLLFIRRYKAYYMFEFILLLYGSILFLTLTFGFSFAIEPMLIVFPFTVYFLEAKECTFKKVITSLICLFLCFTYETSVLYFITFIIIEYFFKLEKNNHKYYLAVFLTSIIWFTYLLFFRIDDANKYPFFNYINVLLDRFTILYFLLFAFALIGGVSTRKTHHRISLFLFFSGTFLLIAYVYNAHIPSVISMSWSNRRWSSVQYFVYVIIFLSFIKKFGKNKLKLNYGQLVMMASSILLIKVAMDWKLGVEKIRQQMDQNKGCFTLDYKKLGASEEVVWAMNWSSLPHYSVLMSRSLKVDTVVLANPPWDDQMEDRCKDRFLDKFNIDRENFYLEMSNKYYDTSLFF